MRLSAIASLALSGVVLSTAPESGAAQGGAAECVQEPNGESSMHRHCWDGGKRQGRWKVRLPGGEVREGSYVAGKKQGHWVLRHADGTVEEGPVVDGLREGGWVARRPDGSRRMFEMDGGAPVAGSVRVVAQARGGSGERNAAALTREDRRRIQSALAAQGFDPGPADGVFGPRTSRAIKAWQASNGYAATGVLTGEQAVALPVAAPLTPGGAGQPLRRTGGAFAPSLASDRQPAASARLFAAHALSFRAAGLAGEHEAAEALVAMPGAGMVGDTEALSALWRPFFENAVVKLGRLRSSAPTALYYNPLLDVALLTLWERREGSYRVAAIRALSGERLVDAGADVPLSPPWTASEDGSVAALDRITTVRLEAFRQTHPATVDEAGRDARGPEAEPEIPRQFRRRRHVGSNDGTPTRVDLRVGVHEQHPAAVRRERACCELASSAAMSFNENRAQVFGNPGDCIGRTAVADHQFSDDACIDAFHQRRCRRPEHRG